VKTWIPDNRQFAYLTWQEVARLPRDTTLLILPTAAIEQHGYHLPLATDTLINNLVLGSALQLLPLESPIFALPAICYGKSNEHIGYAGTLSVSASTFMAVLRDIGASLADTGFQRLVLYNSHGGNIAANDIMARDLRAEFGLRTFCLSASGGADLAGLEPQEKAYGYHAGELETSLLLAGCPGLVRQDQYSVNYIADLSRPDRLSPENGPATYAWLTKDVAPSGVLGDPRPSTPEKGRLWLDAMAQKVADALLAMADFKAPYSK
jgi:creatinine amidohydrolase